MSDMETGELKEETSCGWAAWFTAGYLNKDEKGRMFAESAQEAAQTVQE